MSNKTTSDTLDIYWAMLQDIESRTDPKRDILNALMVNQAYAHWNRLHPKANPMKPRWLE